MAKILLSLHVLAAILAIGPVAVAASVFPRCLRQAADGPADGSASTVARALHRICRVYALVGIAVPFFGLATAGPLHVFGDAWVIISIVLTAVAAVLLAVVILPGQRRALDALPTGLPTAGPAVATSPDSPATVEPTRGGPPPVATQFAGRAVATSVAGTVTATSPDDSAKAAGAAPGGRPHAAAELASPAVATSVARAAVAPAAGTPALAAALSRAAARLAMATGMFNLLWATVVVLMIVRPGSTTGV